MAEQANETGLIKDCTTASFRADVIADSARQPVLVDFWAPWCGPCKQLTPVLEKIVIAAGGKIKLVKMNIDEHPQIASQLAVKSIPAVFAFQKGQPVDGFMGALPESQIRAFLERLIGPVGGENETLLKEAAGSLAAGDARQAADLFAQSLSDDPAQTAAIGGLASALVMLGDLTQAKKVLATAPQGSDHAAIAAARAALENAEQAESVGDLSDLQRKVAADPKDFQAKFDLAIVLNACGQREEAADTLLEIIRANRTWNDDGARKQLLLFFDAWGAMDADTLNARRKLSGVLFS